MTYNVKETITGCQWEDGYQSQSTLDGFKNIIMRKSTFTDVDYFNFMDNLNISLWDENKEMFKSAEISDEVWDESTQTYTRTRTWPSKDIYDKWSELNLFLYNNPNISGKIYDSLTQTFREEI